MVWLQNFLFTFHTLRHASRFIRDWLLSSEFQLQLQLWGSKQQLAKSEHQAQRVHHNIGGLQSLLGKVYTFDRLHVDNSKKPQKNIQVARRPVTALVCVVSRVWVFLWGGGPSGYSKQYWVGFDAEIHVMLQPDTSFLRYNWLPAEEGSYTISSVSLF